MVMAARRVSSLSVILLSFSLLALFSVNLYSLKLSKNVQVHYGDKFFKYFNSYSVDFNLISPRHMSRIGGHFVTSPHKKFQKSRVAYYSNCTASFNPVALSVVRSGDIHPHPGPHRQCNSTCKSAVRHDSSRKKCKECDRTIARNHRATICDCCSLWSHIKCGGVTPKQYLILQSSGSTSHTCESCMEALRQLPFADSSLNSSTSTNSSTGSCSDDETWSEYDALIKKHWTNIKIGHVNVDHIAGFKFFEVKYWLLEGKFDILVLSETKLDSSFPDSQFMVTGYRMCRADRNIHGGGLLVYIRADLCFKVIKDLPNLRLCERERYKTESIVLKVRIAKKWETIVGFYRPPTSASIPQSLWKFELSSILEAITILPGNCFFVGDFNSDMLLPDKPPRDGRVMANLLDIYDLKNLIHEATRITKTSETLLDLFLTDNLRKIQSSGVVHVNISDHSLVFAMLRASEPRIRSRKIQFRSLKNFDKQHFLHDLHNVPFQVAEIFDDVDDKLYVFDCLYEDILGEHAPLKQVRIRGNQVPFMNEQWRKAIRQKNRLWKRFIRERTDTNYELYKRQGNICTSLRRKAIKISSTRKVSRKTQGSFGTHTAHFCIQGKARKQMT